MEGETTAIILYQINREYAAQPKLSRHKQRAGLPGEDCIFGVLAELGVVTLLLKSSWKQSHQMWCRAARPQTAQLAEPQPN